MRVYVYVCVDVCVYVYIYGDRLGPVAIMYITTGWRNFAPVVCSVQSIWVYVNTWVGDTVV